MYIKNRKAAMEMSVGTIVTIVLLMTVLILGLVLVRTIFKTSTDHINEIDQAVKNEINKLFTQDSSRKVVIYPVSREISFKKGEDGGFGFSIRNNDPMDGAFSYDVSVTEIAANCKMTERQAEDLIILGKSGNNIQISSGSSLETPILVKFEIPETASICNIRYGLNIEKDGVAYTPTMSVDLNIK